MRTPLRSGEALLCDQRRKELRCSWSSERKKEALCGWSSRSIAPPGLSLSLTILIGDMGAERWPRSLMSTTSETIVGLSLIMTLRGLAFSRSSMTLSTTTTTVVSPLPRSTPAIRSVDMVCTSAFGPTSWVVLLGPLHLVRGRG